MIEVVSMLNKIPTLLNTWVDTSTDGENWKIKEKMLDACGTPAKKSNEKKIVKSWEGGITLGTIRFFLKQYQNNDPLTAAILGIP